MSEKYFRAVNSIPVNGKTWGSIEGMSFPKENIPLRAGHIPELCRFVVGGDVSNNSFPKLVQTAPTNERTFAVQFGDVKRVIFSDQFGNTFGCFDLKGNESTKIEVKISKNAPSGFIFWGIQEADSLTRAMRASEYIRARKIDTEIILRVIEPEEIPYQGKRYNPEEFKTKLLLQSTKDLGKEDGLEAVDIPKLGLALEGMEFVHTLRGKKVQGRLFDLHQAPAEVIQQILEEAFWFYNSVDTWASLREDPYSPVDPNNSTNVADYLARNLPYIIGSNYGKLHRGDSDDDVARGVVHVHPHLQNISTLGGIYDVDSMTGEPLGLGDAPITDEEVITDMHRLMYGYWDNPEGKGLIPFFRELALKERIPNESSMYMASIFELYLMYGYMSGRRWEKLLPNIDVITKIISHDNRAPFSFFPGKVLEYLCQSEEWKYELKSIAAEEVAEEIFVNERDSWKDQLNKGIDADELIRQIFEQGTGPAKDIFRRKLYDTQPEAFDSVKNENGENISNALLDLAAIDQAVSYPLKILDHMYGDSDNKKDHMHAVGYVWKMIK